MKFQKNTRRRAKEYEKALLDYWREHKTFEKSVEQRSAESAYVFYDGPPFITGVPHHGTLLSSIIKDAVPRFHAMRGKRVERVWGWDCHGLPAEVFTEKKLGIKDKRDIGTKISLEEYIKTCRANMVQTGSEWENTIARIGRWVDMRGAYRTMDKDYMESVWWAFKTLYDKGKIYEGEKVLLYCTRDATPISKAEVAMDNSYQDVTDPSVFVKFKLKQSLTDDDKPTYMLAWTTTPWTLPANTALAVNSKNTYQVVQHNGENFVIDATFGVSARVFTKENSKEPDFIKKVAEDISGRKLVGLEYEPLFDDRGKNAHKIWHADYVSAEEGTGIVHLAPAYGEEDYELAREKDFPLVSNIDDNGFYKEGEWKGQYVWDANKPIAKTLHDRGVVWKIDYIRHSYPHCHRCGTKLMYRAHPSWFMDIDGQRQQMLGQNGPIEWFPPHIKHGRWAKTIESAPDWNLSRDRFWATAMPVWKGTDKHGKTHVKVVGSYAELKELSSRDLDDYHRPWIDDVTFEIDGVTYRRIDRVLDCWFESGSMPFAQFHYPFENVDKFEASFPGDFIAEYVGQVRAWFYYVHAVNVGLFGKNAFKNVIVTGTLAGNDGRKMSKSFGNFTDPNELMDAYSADSLRFLLLSSPVLNGEDFSLQDKDVGDIARKLGMAWNMFDFFTLYADVDGWEWDGDMSDPTPLLKNPLDQWIVSRVHQLVTSVTTHMEGYDLPNATKPVLEFLEDASNWYVRRSRKRFWKSQNDGDKQAAYRTLHYVLVQLSIVMAPFTPFLADELYQKLTGCESVHLLDWPEAGHVNEIEIEVMHEVRRIIEDGLRQRALAGIKVRQPLKLALANGDKIPDTHRVFAKEIICEELNLKELYFGDSLTEATKAVKPLLTILKDTKGRIVLDETVTPELKREGLARDVIRHVQNARKQAGLDVDDRIKLSLVAATGELQKAVAEHAETIKAETLADLLDEKDHEFSVAVVVDGAELRVSLEKA